MAALLVGLLFGHSFCSLAGGAKTVVPEKQSGFPREFDSPSTNSSANVATSAAVLMKGLDLKQTGSNTFAVGKVTFDKQTRIVTIPARVNPGQSVIEYALVTETGKTHESLLITEVQPRQVHLACLLLGLGQGKLIGGPDQPEIVPATNAVQVEVTWEKRGRPARYPLAQLVALRKLGSDEVTGPLAEGAWFYNGSEFGPEGFRAEMEGSIISLIRDPAALVNNPRATRDNDDLHAPNKELLPKEGAAVKVILRLPALGSSNAPVSIRGTN